MRRFLTDIAVFLATSLVVYLVCLVVLCVSDADRFFPNVRSPDNKLFGLSRFRDAEAATEAQVVAFGSSLAYRGFDPRVFAERGLDLQVIGSSLQTPLHSYYLARRFLPRIKPQVVLVEVYWLALADAYGEEGTLEIVRVAEPGLYMAPMVAASRSVRVVNSLCASLMVRRLLLRRPLADTGWQGVQRYVGRGYVEHSPEQEELAPLQTHAVLAPSPVQLEYLERLIDLVHSSGARVMLVRAPHRPDRLPPEDILKVRTQPVTDLARNKNVPFLDYTQPPRFTELGLANQDFYDGHHLNQSGVEKFNRALVTELLRVAPAR